MMRKRVLELRRDAGWFAIIRFLTPEARQIGFTQSAREATDVTAEQLELLRDIVGERRRFVLRHVDVDMDVESLVEEGVEA